MLLFDYKMTGRPLGIGCQPKGAVSFNEASKHIDGHHGIVSYDRQLTEEEIYSFELEPVIGVLTFSDLDSGFRFQAKKLLSSEWVEMIVTDLYYEHEVYCVEVETGKMVAFSKSIPFDKKFKKVEQLVLQD